METLDFILSKSAQQPPNDGRYRYTEIPQAGRDDLAKWLHELDFKRGAEIGVAAGHYSATILAANPQMKLYGVDSWLPYKGYKDFVLNSTFQRLYEDALSRTSQYPNYEIIKEFSMDALSHFEDNSLDFVYIDANHSEPFVSQDINEWYKKVRPGGILAGHDYAKIRGWQDGKRIDSNWQVKEAVNKYTKENRIVPWFVIGLDAKNPGEVRDPIRSWLIVKQ